MGYSAVSGVSELEQDFLGYLTSDEAQSALSEIGFINQTITTSPLSAQGVRLSSALVSAKTEVERAHVQDFASKLTTADRLSTTFRFVPGTMALDAKGTADIARVSEFLSAPKAMGRRVLILGFTDNIGRFDLNIHVSLQQAQIVRDALVAATDDPNLIERIEMSPYGPLAPVGCNETAQGRHANRRVEIWLL
jgi:phosphate transport system substrate-binding protein